MKILIKIIYLLLPFTLIGQATVFKPKEEIINLPSNHYQLENPLLPIINTTEKTVDFIGFSYSSLFYYKENSSGGYTQKAIPEIQGDAGVIAYEDFNNDGKKDILTKSNLYKLEDTIYKQIYFDNPFLDPKGFGDFNKDGLLDLIAYENEVFGDDDIYYLKNLGNFKFDYIKLATGKSFETFASGDIDNDGDLDFVMTSSVDYKPLYTFFNNGDNTFKISIKDFNEEDCSTISVELFDIDKDKDLDLIMQDAFEGIYIIENTDNFETFQKISEANLNSSNYALIVKPYDFNKDGFVDLAIFRQSQNTLYIEYLEATGKFKFKPIKELASFKGGVLVGYFDGTVVRNSMNLVDLNFDGLMDITFTAGFDKKQFSLINSTISNTKDINIKNIVLNPNVVSDFLYLDIEKSSILDIYSLEGIRMYHQEINSKNIDVRFLPGGIYIAKISQDGKLYSARFIKY